MRIKAVFFDIDGTLLTDNRSISSSTIAAINQLKQQGIVVGVATGRGPRFVLPYMALLGLEVAVTYNGQYILSRERILFEQALPKKEIVQMIAYAKHCRKDLSFGTATKTVGSRIMSAGSGHFAYRLTRLIPSSWAGMVNAILNRFLRQSPLQEDELEQLVSNHTIYQMMLLVTERETKKLRRMFPQFEITRSSPYAADIISKGNSKLEGIRRVGEFYQYALDEVIAFGDSNNDLEMLAGIPHSVAMKNGTKKARQAASYVTDTNNKDGIFKALVHFGLVKEGTDDVSKSG